MAADPYKYFRLEARELLDQCAQTVLELEKGAAAPPLVQRLLRLAHTLKGAARVVKQVEIADRAHAIEEALAPFREAGGLVSPAAIAAVFGHLDESGRRLTALMPEEPAAPVAAAAGAPEPPTPDEAPRTIRADIIEMDAVIDGVAETHAVLSGLRQASHGLEQVQRLADVLVTQLAAERRQGGASDRLFALAEELHRKLGTVERGFGGAVDQMDRELRELRDAAERLRLVPADTLFTRLERTARDTAAALGKELTFQGQGGEMRLDAQVLGTLQSALIQLVRNAAAHGIESPDERRRAGKPPAGRIIVSLARRGRQVELSCQDDGAGLDLDAIRRAALRQGKPVPTDADGLIRLLLRGGITTSPSVTEMAGRGIGLDILREAVERLGGKVAVETTRGRGTIFRLSVPPSLAALDALLVAAGDDGTVVIPLDAVRSTARLLPDDILPAAPGVALLHEGQAIPFLPLSTILEGARQPLRRHWSAIILAGAGGLAAIGVDRLLGTAKIVLRPLPDQLPASPVIAGVSLDAQGNPQLVLDADGVVATARRGIAAVEETKERRPVLVIDDSLTTRMLEQSILEAAGYEVDVALSAEEGLEAARRRRYALFLVDVEMPGMDGFSFVEQIRADPALHQIPAILVTSRSAPEDLERGRSVGAQGYMVKSAFDQAALLALIRPLVG